MLMEKIGLDVIIVNAGSIQNVKNKIDKNKFENYSKNKGIIILTINIKSYEY